MVLRQRIGRPSGEQGPHVVGHDRAMKTFQHEFAGLFDLCDGFDGHVDLALDQDLAITGFGKQTNRAPIHHRADGTVVKAALKPDPAERCISIGRCRDRSPGRARACANQPPARRPRRAFRPPFSRPAAHDLDAGERVVEQDHQAVAGKSLERSVIFVDQRAEALVVEIRQGPSSPLQARPSRQRGEAPQIAEHNGNVPPITVQLSFVAAGRKNEFGDLRRQKPLR